MSGSFEDLDVPPTLVSFAVSTGARATASSPRSSRRPGSTVVPAARRAAARTACRTCLRASATCSRGGGADPRRARCAPPGRSALAAWPRRVFKMVLGQPPGLRLRRATSTDAELFAPATARFRARGGRGARGRRSSIGAVTRRSTRCATRGESLRPGRRSRRSYEAKLEHGVPLPAPTKDEARSHRLLHNAQAARRAHAQGRAARAC